MRCSALKELRDAEGRSKWPPPLSHPTGALPCRMLGFAIGVESRTRVTGRSEARHPGDRLCSHGGSGTLASCSRPASASLSGWLLALAPRRPGRRCRRPTQARPELLGHDLDHRPGAAVLSRPAPLLESAHDHDPAALGQGLGGVLGLVAPDDDGEERCLLLPPTADGDPEPGPGDAALGGADLGLVGEVAGEADARPRSCPAPSCCLAGRSALPLEPGDGGHRGMPRDHRGKRWSQRVGRGSGLPAVAAQVLSWLGGACGWGSGMQHRPARSLHPGRGWRTRLPPRELPAARLRLR